MDMLQFVHQEVDPLLQAARLELGPRTYEVLPELYSQLKLDKQINRQVTVYPADEGTAVNIWFQLDDHSVMLDITDTGVDDLGTVVMIDSLTWEFKTDRSQVDEIVSTIISVVTAS